MKRDVIVIGGGAAGLFCAIEAGKRGRSTLVVERAGSIGKKIAISGGGRCNFTNIYTSADNFLSANPNFVKSALARYTPQDFIALVEKHRIGYHEKKLGQLFCDGSSRQIINMLRVECEAAAVEIRTDCRVSRVEKNADFRIETSQGAFESASLVIATGGLSIPFAPAKSLRRFDASNLDRGGSKSCASCFRVTRPASTPSARCSSLETGAPMSTGIRARFRICTSSKG